MKISLAFVSHWKRTCTINKSVCCSTPSELDVAHAFNPRVKFNRQNSSNFSLLNFTRGYDSETHSWFRCIHKRDWFKSDQTEFLGLFFVPKGQKILYTPRDCHPERSEGSFRIQYLILIGTKNPIQTPRLSSRTKWGIFQNSIPNPNRDKKSNTNRATVIPNEVRDLSAFNTRLDCTFLKRCSASQWDPSPSLRMTASRENRMRPLRGLIPPHFQPIHALIRKNITSNAR